MSAGALTSTPSLTPSSWINAFNTHWAAVFRQYVVLKAEVFVTPLLVGTAQGQVWTRISEESAAPDGSMVNAERGVLNLDSTEDDRASKVCMIWTPHSAEDMTFTSTSSAIDFAYLKIYANQTNTGTAAGDSTTQVGVQVLFHLAFRYFT
jgi:hypothetical protein